MKGARARRKPPEARAARRERYHHGDLRRGLIDAALGILATHDVAALTLRAAARGAGVSQTAPYRHFADKEALLAAVAEEGFAALTAALRVAAAREAGDRVVRLRVLGLTYIRFAVEHPARFRLMFGRALADRAAYGPLEKAAQETFGLLVQGVEAGQRAGLIRSGDARQLAIAAWSLVHGLSALLVDRQLTPGAATLDAFCAGVLQSLYLGLRHEEAPVR